MFHISVTIGVFLKKIVTLLLLDKRTWKTIGLILSIAITIILLPAIVILSMCGQFTESVDHINQDDFMQGLSVEQQEQFSQMESDGKAIEKELSALGASGETVKAQVIYLTYFDDVQKDEKFFNTYCQIFKNSSDDETLITGLNFMYKKDINYEEFKRSYAMIENVNINKYRFLNLDKKNNIDLARWAVNAYETAWGCVPHTFGNVLAAKDYMELKEKYPDEITAECDKWKSRRTVDSFGLLKSYLCYDAENRRISNADFNKSVSDMIDEAVNKGSMGTLPDRIGTAVFKGDTVGIYVGDNEVIYAKSVTEGVIRENISGGGWLLWFEIPDIEYGEESKFNNEIKFDEYDPTKKNNLGLVQWAIQACENGWGYVYGTYGNVLTEELLQDRAAACGAEVTDYMDFIRENWLGKRTADCVGLIKGYGWYNAETGNIVVGSNGMADVGANAMFGNATVKGTIDTIPEVPGLAVWSDGHIGIYIGNGETIEAANTLRGVMRSRLAGREWTHWLQIPYISYVAEKEKR